jgi:predicted SAM-dependent methyltransferase
MSIKRFIIENANVIICKIRSKTIINPVFCKDYVKINLGCGLAVVDGWVNIDGSFNALFANAPKMFLKLAYRLTGAKYIYSEKEYLNIMSKKWFFHYDLNYGVPFANEKVDFIFTSHFIEHLYKKDAFKFLTECKRVLKKGGILRVSVPDLEIAYSMYLNGNKDEMLENYFFFEDCQNKFSHHRYMYDFEMLSKILFKLGFSEIRRCEFGLGNIPDVELLDNRPNDSLFIEARK